MINLRLKRPLSFDQMLYDFVIFHIHIRKNKADLNIKHNPNLTRVETLISS